MEIHNKKKKMEIHLHTNNTCNLRCIHCYNNSGAVTKEDIPPANALMDVITYFCEKYDAEIHLEGGEIFLRPELLRELNQLPRKFLKNITITTNGTIRHDETEILDTLRKIEALRVSVEGGIEEQQMAVRGIPLLPVLENAAFYRDLGVPVWLRMTLNKYNYEHFLDDGIPALIDQKFHLFQVYEFQKVGRGRKHNHLALEGEISYFLEELEQVGYGPDVHMRIMFSERRKKEVLEHGGALEKAGMHVEVIPAENGVSIHSDGRVYLCSWDNDRAHELLNIYKMGIEEAGRYLDRMNMIHACDFCSAVRITC